MAFSHDSKSVFISDGAGNIKMEKWREDTYPGHESNYTEEPIKVGGSNTYSICLTKDEKYLLVGSNKLLQVFETTEKIVQKKFKLKSMVEVITLTKNGHYALIGEYDGNLSILDLETLEISLIAKNITTNRKRLCFMTLI